MKGTDYFDGADGEDGVSPTVTVKTNTSTEYVLTITDANGAIDTPNLKGADGSGSGDEVTTNKVTSLSALSTDTQYPSAKCVYDIIGDIESLLAGV
jgi:hypothetical protein